MNIFIIDATGKTITENNADGSTKEFDLPNGLYNVYVEFGIRSNIVGIVVNGNTVDLTVKIIPKLHYAVIIKVVLQTLSEIG